MQWLRDNLKMITNSAEIEEMALLVIDNGGAALEATVFQTKEVLDTMEKDANIPLTDLKFEGGMVANNLIMPIQSDVLNTTVVRPLVTETTALGATYVAGLHVGYWEKLDDLRRNWREDKRWTPAMSGETQEKMYNQWKRAVQRTMGWIQVTVSLSHRIRKNG